MKKIEKGDLTVSSKQGLKAMKKIIAGSAAAVLSLSVMTVGASATQQAYDNYGYDRYGDPVPSQAGYAAREFTDGIILGCGAFDEPSDLFVSDDLLYVLDKGNGRIVVLDTDMQYVREISEFNFDSYRAEHPEVEFESKAEAAAEEAEEAEEEEAEEEAPAEDAASEDEELEQIAPPKKQSYSLKEPMGLCVDPDGIIYIADTKNSRIVICDSNGKVLNLLLIPDSEVYNAQTFIPRKVSVDKAKNVYVAASNPRGAVVYNPEGVFTGFFGANRVQVTPEVRARKLWALISSDEQLKYTVKSTASPISNMDIAYDGFVFTVSETTNSSTDIVKKLNSKGQNIIQDSNDYWGDYPSTYYSIYAKPSMLTDIEIDENGSINILDYQHCRVFQYDKEGWLLFIMGGSGEQLGTFRNPSAIESYENKIFVSDSTKNNITMFVRTDFGEIVTEATNLLNDGYYEEAVAPWQEVIKRDGNYNRAFIGIGNAYLNSGRYEEAMEYYKISISVWRYDRAYEGYRSNIMRENFTAIVVILAALLVAIVILRAVAARGLIIIPSPGEVISAIASKLRKE